MVETNIVYEGSLRCIATHPQSGARLTTDAPLDNMGKGESFSPTDLVGVALGSCMLTIMGIAAEKMKVDLRGTKVRVIKEMSASPPRRIASLTVEFNVPALLSPEQQEKLRNAAMTCPVHKSLHPDVKMPITFHFAG